MVEVTSQALVKIREFESSKPEFAGKPFRITVNAGGCSGFSYDYTFDQKKDGDSEWTFEGVQVIVDKESLPFVMGSTVDYVEDFQGSGFTVSNPNSTGSCGCGKSFSA
jgi:iron-sulfur cluster assembly accessory protein